jgi:tight adherence protein B
MASILFPAVVAAIVFIVFLLLMPKWVSSDEDRRKKAMLDKISNLNLEQGATLDADSVNLLKEERSMGALAKIPGVSSLYILLQKSGLEKEATPFFLGVALLFFVLALVLHKLVIGPIPLGIIVAFILAIIVPRQYLKNRIAQRNIRFLNLFPDAIDMIVRSIKSGHPLNVAMKLIADNMDDPVREEFKQVVDEVSYGRPLTEALGHMAKRIGEADLNFFVVVLSVQQETGGSLAEVLTNLSNVIRKRRQLYLKVRALTSEGRVSSYVLGSLPVIMFAALYWLSPSYLEPFFTTTGGKLWLTLSITLIIAAIWVVRMMVRMEV